MRRINVPFKFIILLPFIIILIGTFGFMLLEKLSFMNALYFTVVTISTVGYGDVSPATTGGKIFSIILIVFGIGSFLTIVSDVTQMLVQRGRENLRRQRLQMIIGVFFTEVGNRLLRIFAELDGNLETLRSEFNITDHWNSAHFIRLQNQIIGHSAAISIGEIELKQISEYLEGKSDLLLRQLENPDLIEHESFTELLWATVHLRDELMYRSHIRELPESDLLHLSTDIKRVYLLLIRQWLSYLLHLKEHYPYLYSLAIRTNPFMENQSVIVLK